MSKLHECARRMGVELETDELYHGLVSKFMRRVERPDLEIAHDLLAKVAAQFSEPGDDYLLMHEDGASWRLNFYTNCSMDSSTAHVNFIEAVIALCERSKP